MSTETTRDAWSLEVARGPDAGRRYALGPGAVVLGNNLDGEPGIDLSDQERTAPRRMAAKQARIDVAEGALTLRDLGSPGGTFVNRRRVLANEARPLQVGDVIQLGGVQLRVARGGASAQGPSPRPEPNTPPAGPQTLARNFLFALKSGAMCRSWDDFLAISAQRWADLRDELTSGRLSGFLASIGRTDLMPDPGASGSPDERLDAWIGRLPAIKPAKPELDVHPRSLVLRAPAGGGLIRRKLRISNAGYRLLRTTARVEPEGASWLKVAAECAGKTIVTVESDDLTIEADVPEGVTEPRSASVVLESNGGTITVAVRVEPASGIDGEPAAVEARPRSIGIREAIARQAAAIRWSAWPIAAFLDRGLIGMLDAAMPGAAGSPGLLGPAVAFAAVGAIVAGTLWLRGKGEPRDLPPSALTGAILGAMTAAVCVAACRTIERPFAAVLGASWLVAGLVWAAVAVAMAGLSLVLAPPIGAEVRS